MFCFKTALKDSTVFYCWVYENLFSIRKAIICKKKDSWLKREVLGGFINLLQCRIKKLSSFDLRFFFYVFSRKITNTTKSLFFTKNFSKKLE